MFVFSDKKNPEFIRENFVIRAPFCKDKSEKLISEPHLLKVQTFIPPVINVPGRWHTGKPFKTRFQKKKDRKNRAFFFKLNIFIINNFLDQFSVYHRKGHVLNFTNMSLSIFSVANSISYTASKTVYQRNCFLSVI